MRLVNMVLWSGFSYGPPYSAMSTWTYFTKLGDIHRTRQKIEKRPNPLLPSKNTMSSTSHDRSWWSILTIACVRIINRQWKERLSRSTRTLVILHAMLTGRPCAPTILRTVTAFDNQGIMYLYGWTWPQRGLSHGLTTLTILGHGMDDRVRGMRASDLAGRDRRSNGNA